MDLLFSKYASPFSLLDGYIGSNRLFDFVLEFIEIENERVTWEFYLHKVENKSYSEFKTEIEPIPYVQTEDIETTISESMKILDGFKPR